jgi:hypothetical protein
MVAADHFHQNMCTQAPWAVDRDTPALANHRHYGTMPRAWRALHTSHDPTPMLHLEGVLLVLGPADLRWTGRLPR